MCYNKFTGVGFVTAHPAVHVSLVFIRTNTSYKGADLLSSIVGPPSIIRPNGERATEGKRPPAQAGLQY